MQNSGKKKAKIVKKPYLTGSITDGTTLRTALIFCGSFLVVGILYLIVCGVMMFNNLPLRILVNGAILAATLLLFYSSGTSQGTIAVNQGEIMYRRKENGNEVGGEELKRSYHPWKGLATGLMGSLPLIVFALILAVTAQRQMSSLGALPSWVSGMSSREEVTDAVSYYMISTPLGLTSILRVLIRILLMPIVNMIGSENPEGLLLLERLSPLILLAPAAAYGFGYTRGVRVRTQVHTDIAANKRKRSRKSSRTKAKRVIKTKQPEQLN